MKRLAAVVALLVLPVLAEDKGLKPGFRDLKWGDAPPAEGMTPWMKDPKKVDESFTREADKLAIGDAKLERIIYRFFKRRLYAVTIRVSKGSTDRMVTILTENWGKPTQSNPYLKNFFWSKGETLAGFDAEEFDGEGQLEIFNAKTYEEVDAANKAKAAKAKDDL